MKTILLMMISFFLISCYQNKKTSTTTEPLKPGVVTVGKFITIKGTVLKNDIIAKEGDLLVEGDIIETKERSFARMEMGDQTIINLGQNSKINLKDYKLSDYDNRVVNIDLIIGKVKTHFRKKLEGNKGSLKVSSGLASFGVRGTEFITESTTSGKTKMLLLEGKVILTKKKQNSEEKQEIEIKPLEIVTFEEKTEEVLTQTVSEEVLVQAAEDEDLNMEIQQVEESFKVNEQEVKTNLDESPKSSSSSHNKDVQNLLFSLEHGSKALPFKENGKIVYYDGLDKSKLAKNKKGEVIAVDTSLDKGNKKYRVPVVYENGEKAYVAVSEEYLISLMKQSNNLGIHLLNRNLDESNQSERLPASYEPLKR